MNEILRFILFFGVFFAGFFLINYYVVAKMLNLFGLKGISSIVIYIIAALLAISLPLSMSIERNSPSMLSKAYYVMTTTWVALMFYLFLMLIAYQVLSRFLRLDALISGIVIVILLIMVCTYGMIKASNPTVKEIEIEADVDQQITIVQLSDVHLGTMREKGFVERVMSRINKRQHDMIVITGDLFDGSRLVDIGDLEPFSKEKKPVYFITGNHEVYDGREKVLNMLNKTDIIVLDGKSIKYMDIEIFGIGFEDEKKSISIMDKFNLSDERYNILLEHVPYTGLAEKAEKKGFDLMLSGHTHNGQLVPFNLAVRLVFRYVHGMYDVGGMKLYVSSGTGLWGPMMRIGTESEITFIHIVPKKSQV